MMTPQQRLNYQLIGVNQVLATILSYFVYYMIWREGLVKIDIPKSITAAEAFWELAKYAGILACMFLYIAIHMAIEPQLFPFKNRDAVFQLLMRYLYLPVFSVFSELSLADAIFVQFSIEIISGAMAFVVKGIVRTKEKNLDVGAVLFIMGIVACGVFAFLEPVIRSLEGYEGDELMIAVAGVAVIVLNNVISLTKKFFMLKDDDELDELHPWRKQWLDDFNKMQGKKLAIYIPMMMPIVVGFFGGCWLLLKYATVLFSL